MPGRRPPVLPFIGGFSRRRIFLTLLGLAILLFFLWPSRSVSESERVILNEINANRDAHPIERLHLNAKLNHNRLIDRQSTTYLEAKAEYKRRFRREPPWAWSSWFKLAKMWDSLLVDDGYDQIIEQLEPYREYFAHDCDQAEYSSYFLSQWRLIQLCFENRQVSVAGFMEKWYVEALKYLVTEFKDWAPNVCILINVEDEPRVLLPYEVPGEPHQHDRDEKGRYQCPKLTFQDRRHKSIWPDIQGTCGTTSFDDKHASEIWSNATYMTDVCRIGPDLHHGSIDAPDNMMISSNRVPILSAAKLSPFADILFPNPWRLTERPQWHDFDEVDWDMKAALLYWRGSTTGGYAHGSQWHFHRQNMIKHLNDFHHLTVNARFTNATQCNEQACAEQHEELPFAVREPLAEAWKHMLVLDMDGNGASGRLYDLLRSSSTVVRHSFMREWHDERLIPWLHYAPLSSDMSQVDETVEYLLSPEGEKVAFGIAQAGTRAVNDTLRFQDVKLYFYRLILEMGRDKKAPAIN